MPKFEVVSEYQPAGDQPEAIAALAAGIENGLDEQTLLGVTGSGKTFTMAKVIEAVSYTHLDVYKRQVYSTPRVSSMGAPSLTARITARYSLPWALWTVMA